MICDSCGQEAAKVKHGSRSYGKGDEMIVIDNVPVVVCTRCGQSYMTADTMQEIARLRLHKRNVKTERLAPVISYV